MLKEIPCCFIICLIVVEMVGFGDESACSQEMRVKSKKLSTPCVAEYCRLPSFPCLCSYANLRQFSAIGEVTLSQPVSKSEVDWIASTRLRLVRFSFILRFCYLRISVHYTRDFTTRYCPLHPVVRLKKLGLWMFADI